MASKKPTQPPSGADMSALVGRVNELSQKVLNKGFTSKLPNWKRWVGGEAEYDVSGLRDVVNSNAITLDDTNAHLLKLDAREANHYADLSTRVAALEAQPRAPFPVSG
jgi:hypothetical protein